jgi:hypothetical protein
MHYPLHACFSISSLQLINDAIHGPIELSPLLYQIINTPEFHRLKDLRQLGRFIIQCMQLLLYTVTAIINMHDACVHIKLSHACICIL